MQYPYGYRFGIVLGAAALCAIPAGAATIYYNLTPSNLMAAASRQGTPGAFEIESADDFLITGQTTVNSASVVGLFVPAPTGAGFSISQVTVEIYRVFPQDSDITRTPNVPTRINSPSDIAFDSRSSSTAGQLSFTSSVLANSFTALNSVQAGGIHPRPNQTTGGNGAVSGQEVQLNVTFTTPLNLAANHYFFIPQITLTNGAQFYWLSASRPISGAGTTPFAPDLQAWTRDNGLDPDWLRIGTDIVGGATSPTFNLAFSLDGTVVPEPASLSLITAGLLLVAAQARRKA